MDNEEKVPSVFSFKAVIKWLAIIAFMPLFFSGCAGYAPKAESKLASSAPSLNRIRASYRNALGQYGILVRRVGQVVKIIIPSDITFQPASANFRVGQNIVLATVARLVATYKTIYVRVSAYTDDKMPAPLRLALSDKRAEVVAGALWQNGIDSRILTAVGSGSRERTDSNQYRLGRLYNRRVVVTFRFLSGYYPVS